MNKIQSILFYILTLVLILLLAGNAKSAEIYIPEGQNYIFVKGTIVQGDRDDLEYYLEALDYTNEDKPAHILLESGGGSLVEGVKMAVLIKLSGISTVVTSDCASACSVVFASGYHRVIMEEGRVGLHTPYSPVYNDEGVLTAIIEEEVKSSSWWVMYGVFISSLQDEVMAKRWIDFSYITPSKAMFWITKDNATLFGITHIE